MGYDAARAMPHALCLPAAGSFCILRAAASPRRVSRRQRRERRCCARARPKKGSSHCRREGLSRGGLSKPERDSRTQTREAPVPLVCRREGLSHARRGPRGHKPGVQPAAKSREEQCKTFGNSVLTRGSERAHMCVRACVRACVRVCGLCGVPDVALLAPRVSPRVLDDPVVHPQLLVPPVANLLPTPPT